LSKVLPPQREPTMLISSTTTGEALSSVVPWNVDFKTSVPRGRRSFSAVSKPVGEPEASIVTSNARAKDEGSSSVFNASTPRRRAMSSFD
jgi:hypothetical protein